MIKWIASRGFFTAILYDCRWISALQGYGNVRKRRSRLKILVADSYRITLAGVLGDGAVEHPVHTRLTTFLLRVYASP